MSNTLTPFPQAEAAAQKAPAEVRRELMAFVARLKYWTRQYEAYSLDHVLMLEEAAKNGQDPLAAFYAYLTEQCPDLMRQLGPHFKYEPFYRAVTADLGRAEKNLQEYRGMQNILQACQKASSQAA